MNILQIHNGYQQPGGEDVVVAQERRLLERRGHKVSLYHRSNHELETLSFRQRCRLITRIVSASDSRLAVRALLRELKPDVVHVHNTFAMVSPGIYEVCHEENAPVVQTLHNYRVLCPASTLYRDGASCEECVRHGLLSSVRHGCYHDSRAMSAAIALMLQVHRSRNTWDQHIDAYIALSNFARNKFVEAGIAPQKIHVKPNFVEPDPGERSHPGTYAVFVGRLSPEKGAQTLLEAWQDLPAKIPLVIVGDGPMRPRLEAEAQKKKLANIAFAGRMDRGAVYQVMKSAAFVVVPSVWWEPFGLVVAEALACGTPVLGASVGAIPEMLQDYVTGLHFAPGDPISLRAKAAWAWKHLPELAAMGKAARQAYLDCYSAEVNYSLLMNIYASAIDIRTRSKPFAAAA